MKILHIITGLNNGGAEGVLYRLCKYDSTATHVVVSLMDEGKYGSLLTKEGVDVFCLNLPAGKVSISALWRLFKLIRSHNPDIVQTWLYHADLLGGLAAKLAGVKHIVWGIRTTELKKRSYITAGIRKLLAWLSYWIPTKIVVVAEKAKQKHISIGYDSSKMQVIPNGFDVEAFHAAVSKIDALKQEIGLTQQNLVIGCVGRLSQVKGQDVFTRAAGLVLNHYPNVKFLMVGRGLEFTNAEVMDWISKTPKPQNFILLGERSDVPVCLRAMDIFCLPSRSEGFPNALGEAMLAGVPCVSTDAGDAALLGGNDVPIVEVDNPEDLANKLMAMLAKSVEERNEIGERLHQRIIDEYSIQKMVSRYVELYKELEGTKN
ncbi:MAG: glycosyl transferase [Shewanella sp. CG18_big_fil_WC_8_21_14_2_50_42_11]|uniref:glycosyltransferase family 4 protein n=1 Tax=Shewanella TaxID=22 RepID=UPI000C4C96A3|nr:MULTISPECIES: glycosyltransferase [Shewanella]NCP72649.1 glycosyltransferase [Shewanella vesiculosa]PIQ02090.1 MAG: glycosyl transferase [Shewanella sp. CG18_big_fil_WC_8_21_14_2_50_42_11]